MPPSSPKPPSVPGAPSLPGAPSSGEPLSFRLNGAPVQVDDDGATLLEVLRGTLAVRSPKDGCSPQGQCGCCTVLVDGAPRVACVTPARRVEGRTVTTVEGLDAPVQDAWADAFVACGASQCGFCTPGIIVRLEGLRARGGQREGAVDRALAAHLCRCTGWQTIREAFDVVAAEHHPAATGPPRDLESAGRRATLELGAAQHVGRDVVLGAAGFSADTAPDGCLVAVPDPEGGWVVADTLVEARRRAAKVQGRRTTLEAVPPVDLPDGDWDVTLRTSWVDPAYVETDASWCAPGGEPSPPAANGGAFGGKRHSPLPAAARALADEHGRAVLALWSREDCTRLSPKRPPLAAGIRSDGTGVVRVVRTDGIADAIRSVAPGLEVLEVDVAGPPTSTALRAAGWAEAVVLLAAVGAPSAGVRVVGDTVSVDGPDGGRAEATVAGGRIGITVDAGDPLDDVVLRSYCIGAAHMALSWVTSESLAVDRRGAVQDLTVRSFGVLRAADMPPVDVTVAAGDGPAVAVSDAVFAAVAAAVWRHQDCPGAWPTGRPLD
jgi:xanthine dehydrogenase small subunit